MTEVTIGPLLRALRERTGRSQAQQAELLSQLAGRPVTRNEISRWENETRLLTPYWQEHTAASFEI
ncbi:MAG: helix-turn-helix domain-containing protein [Pseudonocardia sp.]